VAHVRRESAGDEAAAARDVENPVVKPGSAAATIIRNASALAIGAAALNTLACRLNWSRIKS
jgi:hypothetical protein